MLYRFKIFAAKLVDKFRWPQLAPTNKNLAMAIHFTSTCQSIKLVPGGDPCPYAPTKDNLNCLQIFSTNLLILFSNIFNISSKGMGDSETA